MKVQRRLALSFFIQFVIFFITVFLFTILLIFFLAKFLTNVETAAQSRESIIANLTNFIYITDDQVDLDDSWHEVLKENDLWMQVINKNGKVIYTINTPDILPDSYTINELLEINDSGVFLDYKIRAIFDSWTSEPYYYLFGYKDRYQDKLEQWFFDFNQDGLIPEQEIERMEEQLQELDAFLQIYKDGELIQAIGPKSEQKYSMIELLGRIYEPGYYDTTISFFSDAATGVSWVLHLPNSNYEKTLIPVFSKETQIALIAVIVSLIFTLMISFWNAQRYGQPLMLFVNWLKRMENQEYRHVFSNKERRKIFKKNGKIRYRFRLYEEVIHSLKDLSTKLQQIETERKQLEQTREEWMTGISHDLRTPLSTIQGYGHILESKQFSFSDEELQEIGKGLREKSEYMLQLIDDFSLIFQLKNSTINMDLTPIDANQFVRNVAQKYMDDLTIQHAITFIPHAKTLVIQIDPKWFERVLDNIIYNSIKHNPVSTEIKISLFHDHHFGIIQIEDNGVGMDKEALDKLFNRYYRGTNTMEKNAGTGLGMSIAKGIVDLHGGNIEVQSEPGIGTSIRIFIPLLKTDEKHK